jgi:4-amino-4-deoxy-L-arabinose transferase-like glycosyltransferase
MHQPTHESVSGQCLQNCAGLRWTDLLIVALLAGALFGFMLGNRPLSVPDEGRYVEIPREMVVTGDYLTPRLNGVKYFEKPPLFYWLEAFSIKLFGLHEYTLRLWPALFALFGCLTVTVAGARLFGRLTGLLASVILATSLLYYGMSRVIILDMLVSVLLTGALLSFLIGIRETPGLKRRLYLLAFYAFSALAVLAKGLIGILIPGLVISVWVVLLGEWRLLRTIYLPTGLALFLLIAAPWHIMVGMANPEFFNFYFIHEHLQRYLTMVHGRYQPAWFFIPVVLLGLFPWSMFLVPAIKHNMPSSWQERHEHRDAFFLLLWAGLVFLFFSASDSKLVPYILPVFPPLALLIGRYLAASWEQIDLPGAQMGYVVFLIAASVLSVALLSLPAFLPNSNWVEMLGAWRFAVALTLVIGAAASWGFARQRRFKFAFIALTITSALFLIEVNAASHLVEMKSTKNLASTLKTRLKPGDEVASYRTYYQDLPVYLERRITVVDWKGELGFGTTTENTELWMIDGVTFWKRWDGPSTMFMVTDIKTYEVLRKDHRLRLFPIAQDRRNIVVSNRASRPDILAVGVPIRLTETRTYQNQRRIE